MKKVFALVLAVCMVLSVSAFASGEAGVTITDVTYGDSYIATAATDDDTINSPSASSNITSVTLSDGTVVEAENGGVLTLVVNGDHYDILDYVEKGTVLEEGTYSFETTSGATGRSEMGKFMNMAGNTAQYTYRSALYIGEDGINAEETIPSLLTKATYDENGIASGELNSYGPFFNGIIVNSADYTISDMTITGIGDGANDFTGNAAMVLAQGTADVTIEDTAIITEGVIRTAAAANGNAILRINNSVIYAQETADTQAEYDALVVPMMKRTPFALGLEGVVRATNVLGAAQGIYTDSLIVSTGWGVLSTDSGNGYNQVGTYALNVSNTTAGTGTIEVLDNAASTEGYFDVKTVGGVTYGYTAGGSGYVAYADSGVWDKFDNVKFYGGNEVQIMASSNSSAFYANSVLESGHIGIMTQQNAGGTISLVDSVLNVAETGVQIKSGAANNGYTNVIFDNTEVNFTADSIWGGTLVELVESDDAGNPGNTSFTVNDLGDEATQATATAVVSDSTATLANGEYTGNIWNNIYNKFQALNVTLDNATVNGTISSSYSYHLNDDGTRMENGTVLQADTTGNYLKSGVSDYHKIGAQYNVANEQVNNPLNLTLTNGSVWNIVLADGTCGEADACYVNDLAVEAGSAIEAAAPVTIHVYGTLDVKGEVGANVTIVEEEYIPRDFNGNTLTAFDMADPRHTATFVFEKADGTAVNGVGAFAAYKAFATSYFTLSTGSYDVVSMEVTEGDAVISEITPDNADGYYGEYDYNIAMNTDCTVTVILEGGSSASGEASGGAS
ncbi:MAG: hypothetical protein ACI3W7_08145 [Oscillospiraceae bacterium]